jgi:hypothetical protein
MTPLCLSSLTLGDRVALRVPEQLTLSFVIGPTAFAIGAVLLAPSQGDAVPVVDAMLAEFL